MGEIADSMVDYYSGTSGNYFKKNYNKSRRRNKMLNITKVSIHNLNGSGKCKAMASITIDDCFVVGGFRVLEGQYGFFVSMAQRFDKGSEEYKDIYYPLSKDARNFIQDTILQKFEASGGENVKSESKPKPKPPVEKSTPPVSKPKPTVVSFDDDDDDDEFPF